MDKCYSLSKPFGYSDFGSRIFYEISDSLIGIKYVNLTPICFISCAFTYTVMQKHSENHYKHSGVNWCIFFFFTSTPKSRCLSMLWGQTITNNSKLLNYLILMRYDGVRFATYLSFFYLNFLNYLDTKMTSKLMSSLFTPNKVVALINTKLKNSYQTCI